MPEMPTGIVTFLLTDIETSTRLWEQHPEAMRVALARHDALAAAVIEQHAGALIKSRGEGDSLFAVFARASDALAAACALQQALFAESWPTPTPLRVRVALHTGEAELREGDYYGPAVNRCARLRAIAHGGQVLLSWATAGQVQGTLPVGVSVRDLGEQRLRDLQQPERVFQVLHPELRADFPSLRSLSTLPNNLPQQVTSFIGREREIGEVKRLLGVPRHVSRVVSQAPDEPPRDQASHLTRDTRHTTRDTRLLTLTGSGGCGKTRLALQVAADLLPEYPDGVWLVELARLSDPALVSPTAAAALSVREEPGRSLTQTLLEALKAKKLLLILDNCEHLLAACAALVEALLRLCPEVQVLASSREGLNIAGETTYRVPSLSVPAPGEGSRVEGQGSRADRVTRGALTLNPQPSTLLQFESVRLFIDRATSAVPSFTVTEQTAPSIARICARLDGIPLAIELAAARVKVLTVEKINERLDDRFRLLTGGSRTALPRQQTLRALIDWSYDLLTAPERALLQRLAVFAGGWTLEAAEAVCADDEVAGWRGREVVKPKSASHHLPTPPPPYLATGDVLDLLSQLVEKSLVVYEEEGGEPRYRLLETIRQYSRDRLLESGTGEVVRDRHREFFRQLAEAVEPRLQGAEQVAWFKRLESEHANLRAALEWGLETAPESALRLAGALWRFWLVRGHWEEGRASLTRALERGAEAPAEVRAKALGCAGFLTHSQGDSEQAQPLLEHSLALSRAHGYPLGVAFALHSLGIAARASGDYPAARRCYEESLTIRRATGDRWGTAISLHELGHLTALQGDPEAARVLFEESLAIKQEIGDKRGIVYSLLALGRLAWNQDEREAARRFYEESLAIGRELGDRSLTAGALISLGHVAQAEDDDETARRLYEEGLALQRSGGYGYKPGVAFALHSLGRLALKQDDAAARVYLTESLEIQRKLGSKPGIAAGLEALAAVAVVEAEPERAARLFGAAEALREAIDAPLPPGEHKEYESYVGAVRAALGESAFTDAWAEGRAIPLEQAVAYARENPDDG